MRSWGGLALPEDSPGVLRDDVLAVPSLPLDAVLPGAALAIHHGGAGTTQSATLAGKPSIVVANISEQEHWGRELRRLGVAGKLLARRSVTAASLAAGIRSVLAAPEMVARAGMIGGAMRKEHGVREAVRLITERFGPARGDAACSRQDGQAESILPA